MNSEGKIKTIFICVIAIAIFIISAISMTYAYFSQTSIIGDITLSSNNQFSETTIYNSGTNVNGAIVPSSQRDSNALSTNIMVTSSTSNVKASLMAQVDLASTTFLRSSGKAIMYEVYQKGSSADDTSSASCVENAYTCGESTCYCNVGSFVNHIDGFPFALVSDYSLAQGNNYFDIYIWVDGNNSGNEVTDKTLKTNFFFMSSSSSLTVTE